VPGLSGFVRVLTTELVHDTPSDTLENLL